MGGKEQEYVAEAFATNWIAPLGPQVDAFEGSLADRLKVKSVAALSSGTAALHLALHILGIKRGDRVICQSFTFGASAFPISYCGAEPVFVDSEEDTWNMDPALLEQAIKELGSKGIKPAAIIVVHLYGMPAKMDEIIDISSRYGIPLIEDAAEALGSIYKGKPCGSMGDLSVLSFNGNKIITTSGGGALAGHDAGIIARARFLATQSREPAPYYLHKETGFNYRLSNVLAAIGRGQMEVLTDRVEKRRANFEWYKKKQEPLGGIQFLKEPEGFLSNRWLTTIIFDEKKWGKMVNEKLRQSLEKNNIESRPLWKPLHQQPVFAGCAFWGQGVSDRLFENGLCLPSGSNLNEETRERVADSVMKALYETA
jgi:dTDP-4-amino-4,6-dideoxygalactose transaminase